MRILSINNVLLPVKEPARDLKLKGVLYYSDNALKLVRVEITGTMMMDKFLRGVRVAETYRFLRSTSAFLQTMLAYRRPTPLISVKAYLKTVQLSFKICPNAGPVHDFAFAINVRVQQT